MDVLDERKNDEVLHRYDGMPTGRPVELNGVFMFVFSAYHNDDIISTRLV